MESFLRRWLVAPFVGVSAAVVLAAACGGGAATKQGSASTGTGGKGTGGASTSSSSSSTSGTSTSSSGTGGNPAATTLTLPQLVHGAAYVDTSLFSTFPVVVGVSGGMPDTVDVSIDGTITSAVKDTNRFVANVAMTLSPGPHALVATAKTGGVGVGAVTGSLVAGSGSLQFTQFAKDGLSSNGNLVHDVAGDALVYTWVSNPTGSKHQLWMNRLDGAFTRLLASDVSIADPNDEPLNGYTALSAQGMGVVYRTRQPNSMQFTVKLRVVDPMGKELVPATDLTGNGASFEFQAAGVDPGGFSAAWLHISPPLDGGALPPVEIRFARWDLVAKKLAPPITLDADQPPAVGGADPNPQALEPTAEMSIACNTAVCLVSYVRDLYNATAQLNEQKVFLATVDLATNTLKGAPVVVAGMTNPDPEFWGNQLIAMPDGSFVLVYQETFLLSPACPSPMYGAQDTCCDPTAPSSDGFFAVKIDATGKLVGAPKVLFSFEGSREYPRIAPHPDGFALFWEDQRTECNPAGGFIRMAANVASPDLLSLLDPYVEMPGSIVLPPEDPSLAVTGTNFVTSWSDNRHGNGLLDIKTEQFADTYWRK